MAASTLHAKASFVFVVVVFAFTIVISIAACVFFVRHFANARSKLHSRMGSISLVIVYWVVTYPQVFVGMDMMDVSLCPLNNMIYSETGNSCFLPIDTIWRVLKGANLLYIGLIAPFAVTWLYSHGRSWGKRLMLSMAMAMLMMGVLAAVIVIPYVANGSGNGSSSGILLISDSTPWQTENATDSECLDDTTPLPEPVPQGAKPADVNFLHYERFEDSVLNISTSCTWEGNHIELVSNSFTTINDFAGHAMAMFSFLGYPLFCTLAGVGFVVQPWKLITSFVTRPRSPISKSDFIRRGKKVMEEAQDIQLKDAQAQKDIRESVKRVNIRLWIRRHNLNRQLALLESAEERLSQFYPQGEERDLVWTLQVLKNYATLIHGIGGVIFSVLWILNVALFILPARPISPWLNAVLVYNRDDSVKAYFRNMAVFCFMAMLLSHLFLCTFTGLRTLQNSLRFMTVHAIRPQSTEMTTLFINAWWLSAVSSSQMHMIVYNLSAALFGTAVLDLTMEETSIVYREFPVMTVFARVFPIQFVIITGITLVVKIVFSSCNPASHFMTRVQKYIELGLPDCRF
eukprot:jgi/Tetstr1/444599/TSEL_032448.t1